MFAQKKIFAPMHLINGDIAPCPIEQFASNNFFQNDCGWTRNDLALLAAATTKSQYDAILQNLVEVRSQFNVKDDMKLEDAFKQITPRWCQSPLEISQFAEYAAQLQINSLDDVYKNERPFERPSEQPSEQPSESK